MCNKCFIVFVNWAVEGDSMCVMRGRREVGRICCYLICYVQADFSTSRCNKAGEANEGGAYVN